MGTQNTCPCHWNEEIQMICIHICIPSTVHYSHSTESGNACVHACVRGNGKVHVRIYIVHWSTGMKKRVGYGVLN